MSNEQTVKIIGSTVLGVAALGVVGYAGYSLVTFFSSKKNASATINKNSLHIETNEENSNEQLFEDIEAKGGVGLKQGNAYHNKQQIKKVKTDGPFIATQGSRPNSTQNEISNTHIEQQAEHEVTGRPRIGGTFRPNQ
jgi:hypothetical protein